MTEDDIQRRIDEAKQRVWNGMSPEDRNLHHMLGRHSPNVEKKYKVVRMVTYL